MPRKTILTDSLIEEICGYIETGSSFADACARCGICEASFYNWQLEAETGYKGGKPENGKASHLAMKVKFLEGIKRALVLFKDTHIQRINEASRKDWYASAWMLERKFPDEFAKPDKVKMYGGKDSFEDLTPLAEMLNGGDDD